MDALVQNHQKITGLRAVIRNSKGRVLMVGMKKAKFCKDMAMLEAETMLFGLEIAVKEGFSPLIIETNSLEVVKLVSSQCESKLERAWIVADIHESLRNLQQALVNHVRRKGIGIAYSLAKMAIQVDDHVV